MDAKERRRHVRMKPIPECPLTVVLLSGGPVSTVVPVVDVSVGGLGLEAEGEMAGFEVGATFSLRLTMGRYGEHQFDGKIRWKTPELVGVEFVNPADEKTRAVGRYIAELLERGAPS